METPKRDFFDVLDSVINKSIVVSEKVAEDSIPIATSYLERFEQWLDSKLVDTKVS